jgi:tRNA 5-methylaminomethyl-2-thiouridine biosynthesis bifunctional protein
LLRAAREDAQLRPLAQELQAQWQGLLPGFHRLAFDDGRVLLTLCIGPVQAMLRELSFEADSVYLDGFNPPANPDMWSAATLKAVAISCRRGARVATWTVARVVRDSLREAGFLADKAAGLPPKRDCLLGVFDPPWQLTRRQSHPRRDAGRCVVVGAGLSGSAVAASLARRGWQVQVLDSETAPAMGASGLPAGVLSPHVSPDDSLISRLSRSALRQSLREAGRKLDDGGDWALSGVLQRRSSDSGGLPAAWPEAGRYWSRVADGAQLQAGGLPPGTPAVWHAQAGWIKPARLVAAWLSEPGVQWRGATKVTRLQTTGEQWLVMGADDALLAEADLVVIAAAHASATLLPGEQPLALHQLRGQLSWGLLEHGDAALLPPFPVNGDGSLLPCVPDAPGSRWMTGSTFERDSDDTGALPGDDQVNLARLQQLLPEAGRQLAPRFADGRVQSWVGLRCASPDHLPLVGPRQAQGPWLCTAMGSRGLTFAALCAELLAARLHGEPLPVERRLAQALDAARLKP